MATTVLYASRMMTGREVRKTSETVRTLLDAGHIMQANVVMLRNAGKKSELLTEKEGEEWQPSRRLG